MTPLLKKVCLVLLALGAVWLGCRYLLPILLPFLLGTLLALAAEPAVTLGTGRLKLPRGLAAGLGVTATLVLIIGVVMLLGAWAVKEVGRVVSAVPDVSGAVQQLRQWLEQITDKVPRGVRPVVENMVTELFDGSSAVLSQVTGSLPGAITGLVTGVGSSVISFGTGLLSAYLISARLPRIRSRIRGKLPASWKERYLPKLRQLRHSLWGWLKAQGKLCLVTWGVVSVGLLVLRVQNAIAWAGLIALVDAVPVLGTGTVLIPWAVICLVQGENLRAIGLLCTYGAAAITRTALEPRVVGQQLGLDPLVTLLAVYVGYQLWGFPGLILTPILTSAVKSMVTTGE